VHPRRFQYVAAVFTTLAALAFAPAGLSAQDPDIIRGRITGPDSQPIQNANITVTAISSNINKTARTGRDGIFSVTFPNAEGDYWVNIAAVGFTARRFQIKRLGDEDILIADARLAKSVATLDAVRVQGRRPPPSRADGLDISGTERGLNMSALDILNLGDMASLAATIPGVTYIPGVDGGPAGFSVFGLDPSNNTFMLNGMAVDGSNLPRDAGINSSLNTSPYGAQGGGAGAQMNSRGSSGGNFIVRTMSLTGLTPQMQFSDRTSQSLGQERTTGSLSGRVSGPIKLNTAYYNFSFQFDRTTRPLTTLLNADNVALTAANLAPDSVARLQSALAGLGLPFTVSQFPRANTTQQGSVFGQLNYSPINATGQSFALSLSGNWNRQLPAGGLSLLNAPSRAGTSLNWGGNVGLTHQAMLRNAFWSVTTIGFSAREQTQDPYLRLPSASVRVASALDDGIHVNSIAVGGNPNASAGSKNSSVQFRNNLRWSSMSAKHAFSLYSDVTRSQDHSDQSSNLLGSFSFNSLADFEAGRPTSFSRLLTPREQDRSQITGGIGIQDQWRPNPDLTMTFALRMDASRFGSGPEFNPAVEQAFGIRNDFAPHPVALSPSIRFRKVLGTAPEITAFDNMVRSPRWTLTGGAGAAQSNPNAGLLSQAVTQTGLPSAIQQLNCVGPAAPFANWAAYIADLASIPDECADGSAGTVFASSLPSVYLIDPNYRGTRSYRTNVDLTGNILKNRFSTRLSLSYAINTNVSNTIDINFNPTVRFMLADEGGRPVYVQPSSIQSTTGAIAVRDARVSQLFNRVSKVSSDLRSEARQVRVDLAPVYAGIPNFTWNGSYVFQWNRSQTQGFSSTVGNPLDREWGLNTNNPVHDFRISFNYNLMNVVSFSWSQMGLRSGTPVTPRVLGDINGDGGLLNDRAFVFDPATTADPALASAMQDLLNNGSPIARKCLASQKGELAGLGSCRGPWTFQAGNLQMNLNPLKVRMPQRARLRLSVSNPVGALDLLFNGSANVKGWGQTVAPQQNLLSVRGFDAQTQRFKYEVNPQFGSTRPQNTLNRINPVVINALVSLDIGPARERQTLTQMLDRGRRKSVDPRATEATIKASYSSGGVVNPMVAMLRQADQLKLSVQVADSLSYLNRWFTTRLDSIWTPVSRYLADLPEDYDAGEAYSRYKNAREASFDLLIKIAPGIQKMLTGEQKRLLGGMVSTYLDVRYLKSVRSSTAGGGAAGFAAGGAGMETMVMMSGAGGGAPVMIIR
jgi:hypothetical protein